MSDNTDYEYMMIGLGVVAEALSLRARDLAKVLLGELKSDSDASEYNPDQRSEMFDVKERLEDAKDILDDVHTLAFKAGNR